MPRVIANCANCGKEFEMEGWLYLQRSRQNKGRGFFCSRKCSLIGRKHSEKTKTKISKTQKGIKVPTRGKRKGHPIPDESKQKIGDSVHLTYMKKEWLSKRDLVKEYMKKRGVTKYVMPKDFLLTEEERQKLEIGELNEEQEKILKRAFG
jgi:NUMOD3 motif